MKKLLAMALALLMLAVMLPTTALAAGKPVKVGETEYDTLEAAIAAAEPVNGVITYTILGKVTVTSTDSWIQVVKAGLSNVKEVKFVAGQGVTDAEIVINNAESILADQKYDIDVSFENLTLSHPNGVWVGDLGHATKFFTCCLRNTGAAENTVTYTNCTFPNGVCNNQYGKTIFNNCTFSNTAGYSLWNYGGITDVNNSSFTGTRGIKAYNEGTLPTPPTITIKDTSFTDLTEKAAAVVSKATNVIFMGVSATNCPKGLLQKDIEGSNDEEKVTITANGTGISGEFKITANKSPEAAKTEFSITGGTFTGNTDSVKDYLPEGKTINSNGKVVDNTIVIITPVSSPVFLSGANQTVAPGSAATFRIDKEFSELQSVAVDGVTLDKSNYKAWSGSTYVELTAAHMKTLAAGTHTLSVYFTGDTATTTFTISKDAAKNPTTGANDFVGIAAALAVVSLLGMAAVTRKK